MPVERAQVGALSGVLFGLLGRIPQSPLRSEAKLGVGDSFSVEQQALVCYAHNGTSEFLAFLTTTPRWTYPNSAGKSFQSDAEPAADQADQDAIKEFQAFVDRYPTARISPVRQRLRESKVVVGLGTAVGTPYLRMRITRCEPRSVQVRLENDFRYTLRDGLLSTSGNPRKVHDRNAEALSLLRAAREGFEHSEYSRGKSGLSF